MKHLPNLFSSLFVLLAVSAGVQCHALKNSVDGLHTLRHCPSSAKKFLNDQLSDNDTSLTLGNAGISDVCGADIIEYLHAQHKPILVLSLRNNTLAKSTVKALVQWLADPDCHLLSLDLSYNNFSPTTSLILAKALSETGKVERFVYQANNLGVLKKHDMHAFFLSLLHLRVLDFSYNHIESNRVTSLIDALSKSSSLSELNLSYNPISDNGLEVISNVLPVLDSLTVLKLDFVKSSTLGANAVLKALALRKNPLHLSFRYNHYANVTYRQFDAFKGSKMDITL